MASAAASAVVRAVVCVVVCAFVYAAVHAAVHAAVTLGYTLRYMLRYTLGARCGIRRVSQCDHVVITAPSHFYVCPRFGRCVVWYVLRFAAVCDVVRVCAFVYMYV